MLLESISNQKNLSETEQRMVAEVAIEMARAVAGSVHRGAQTLARAALKDTAFKATLAIVHRNIMVRRRPLSHVGTTQAAVSQSRASG